MSMHYTPAPVCPVQIPPLGVMIITVSGSTVLVLLPSPFALTPMTPPPSTTSPAGVFTTTVPSDPLGSGRGISLLSQGSRHS